MANNQTQIEITAVDKTRVAFDSVNNSLSKLNASASSAGNLLKGIGAAFAGQSVLSFANNAIIAADALNDISNRSGIAVERLAAWQSIAKTSGTDIESFATGLNKASKYLVEHADKLKAMGIEAKTGEELVFKLSDVMAKLPVDSPARAALAMKVFGKAGADLIPILSQGREQLEAQVAAQAKNAKQYAEVAQIAAVYKDQMDTLNLTMSQTAAIALKDLIPALTKVMETTQSATKEYGILVGALAGWGSLFKEVLFSDSDYQKLDDVNNKIKSITSDLASGTTRTDKGIIQLAYLDTLKLTQELKYAAIEKANLEKKLKINQPAAGTDAKGSKETEDQIKKIFGAADTAAESAAKKAQTFIDNLKKQVATTDDAKSAVLAYEAAQLKLSDAQKVTVKTLLDQIQANENLASLQKEMGSYTGDLEAIFKLNEAELTNIELLQKRLDVMSQLQPAERALAQAEIDRATANETYQRNAGDASQRVINFEQMSKDMQRQNEDLNASLILSDKKRAYAQLDLEHKRALETIQISNTSAEERIKLSEQETKNYELRKRQIAQTNSIAKDLGLTFSSAFEEAVAGGKKFSAILQGITQDLIKLIIRRKVTEPLFNAVSDSLSGSSFFGSLFNANGNAFNQSGVTAFASGGVFDTPQMFNYGGNKLGVLGEAGPEAVMPLKRGANGKLGVAVNGTASPGQINNISITVNADGSNRNEAGASELGRRIDAAVRAILIQEKRPGGLMGA
jgi:hypothetical protein